MVHVFAAVCYIKGFNILKPSTIGWCSLLTLHKNYTFDIKIE